jgi:hypothetical protein
VVEIELVLSHKFISKRVSMLIADYIGSRLTKISILTTLFSLICSNKSEMNTHTRLKLGITFQGLAGTSVLTKLSRLFLQ